MAIKKDAIQTKSWPARERLLRTDRRHRDTIDGHDGFKQKKKESSPSHDPIPPFSSFFSLIMIMRKKARAHP